MKIKSLEQYSDHLEKEVAKLAPARLEHHYGEVITAENSSPESEISFIEFFMNPEDVNTGLAGAVLKEMRKNYSVAEIKRYCKEMQKGKFWERITPQMQNIILYGSKKKGGKEND